MYYRAFWQRSCRAAAAGAVLKPSGGNCAVLPKENDGYFRLFRYTLNKRGEQDEFNTVYAGATQVQPDKQGRILIPQNLRDYAGLQKDLVIVGASNRAEIWDQERWNRMCEEVTSDMIAQTMDELDF